MSRLSSNESTWEGWYWCSEKNDWAQYADEAPFPEPEQEAGAQSTAASVLVGNVPVEEKLFDEDGY